MEQEVNEAKEEMEKLQTPWFLRQCVYDRNRDKINKLLNESLYRANGEWECFKNAEESERSRSIWVYP
jgi:hypothetical protein